MGRFCVVLLWVIVAAGCSRAPQREVKRSTPAAPWPSSRIGQEIAAATDRDELLRGLFESLTADQVRAANLHHRLHPEHGGTHCKPGEGLAWGELTEAQQQVLERLWQMHSERRQAQQAVGPPGAPQRPEPGSIEKGEIFGVGYAVTEDPDGPHTILHMLSQRYPVAVTLELRLPGSPPLPPAIQQEGIDLVATGAYQPVSMEELRRRLHEPPSQTDE